MSETIPVGSVRIAMMELIRLEYFLDCSDLGISDSLSASRYRCTLSVSRVQSWCRQHKSSLPTYVVRWAERLQ